MSLLEPFSKPRWQHRDPAVRLAAVDELEDPATLLEVLQADEDATVRSRALSRIEAPAALDRLIDETPAWLGGALLQQARAQRLRQLLPEQGILPPGADDGFLLRITSLADDAALIEAAIGRIESPRLRMNLATGHSLARARLCAAQSIDDIELLQSLMQQSRHKDKSVFRHCRERLDAHLAAQRSAEERQQRLARLAEDAAALRAAIDAPESRASCLALQQRWAELREHASAEQRAAIQGHLDACAQLIEERETAAAAASAARSAAEQRRLEQAAAAANAFAALLDELAALDPAALGVAESAKAIEGQVNSVEERWVAALRLAHAAPEQTETCKAQLSEWRAALQVTRRLSARHGELGRLSEAAAHLDPADYRTLEKLQQQVAKLVRALPWPEALQAAMPESIGRLREQQALLEQRLAALAGKEQKTLEKVEAALATFRDELATSHFRNADRALNRLRNLLRGLPPARQDHYQHELRPLLARLQEIHDWQGFAIEPKKKELVERMKALVGSTDDADALAARIKSLQDEWKQLGPLSPRKDQALWRAFSGAAEEAWAPCKEAFEQRAGLRKQLFQQRMELVAQLIDYERKIAWPDREQQPQQAVVERPVAEPPIPPQPAPDQAASEGDARGDPGPGLPAPDWNMVRKTLNTARQAFRELGPVDRKQERKSQKALDKVCDRIYAHLEREYAKSIDGKKALIAEAQALAGQEDLRQAIDRAKALQREWKELGPTPQKVDRGLWKDFRGACDAVFARVGEEREQRSAGARERAVQRQTQERARAEQAAERKRLEQERWQRLLDRIQACGLQATDPAKATALWGEDGDLPKGIDAAALAAWRQNGVGDSDADTLREACIALEVLAGIESPPEEKKARMAYQMKRLVEGMGSGPGDSRERLLEAINRFIALRPPADWLGRFGRAVEAVRGPG